MRNFMGYDRRWLDQPHVGDHVGRSIWALGDILATAWIPAAVRPASDLLDRLVASLDGEMYLRTAAYAVLGLSRLDSDRRGPNAQALLERPVEQLAAAYDHTASDDWSLVRGRAHVRQCASVASAPLSAPMRSGRADLAEIALDSLRWLGDECGLDDEALRLPGHLRSSARERRPRRRRRAAARRSRPGRSGAERLRDHTRNGARTHGRSRAFEWFLGRNRLRRPLYDFATGGCSDGLGAAAVNDNEGAESTLAFHQAALLLDAAGVRANVDAHATEPVLA